MESNQNRKFKMSVEDRAYAREYQRCRYNSDEVYREKALNRLAISREHRAKENMLGMINACLIKKLENGPLQSGFGIHVKKSRGRPRQIDANGNRYFKPRVW